MYHVPGDLVPSGNPMVLIDGLVILDTDKVMGCRQVPVKIGRGDHDLLILRETTGRIFHDGKRFRQHLVEHLSILLGYFFFQFVHLVPDRFTFIQINCINTGFKFLNLRLLGSDIFLYAPFKFFRPGT